MQIHGKHTWKFKDCERNLRDRLHNAVLELNAFESLTPSPTNTQEAKEMMQMSLGIREELNEAWRLVIAVMRKDGFIKSAHVPQITYAPLDYTVRQVGP